MNLGELVPILGILSSVALPIGFGMYLGLSSIRAKHKENIELIKQGIVPPARTSPTPNKYRSLRNGFLCLGIGLGLILGFIISQQMILSDEYRFLIMASSTLTFLGLAYVLFFLVTKDKNLDE